MTVLNFHFGMSCALPMSSRIALIVMLLIAFVSSENFEIYTRNQIPDSTLGNIVVASSNPIRTGAKQLVLNLPAFQTVFDVQDTAAVEIDLTITSRRSRHILFCLVKKSAAPNPTTSVASNRPTPDRWGTSCDVADLPSTLLLTNRQWLKKPQGE